MIQTISLLILIFHDDILYWTECYDPQYQKPSEGQQKQRMQNYNHLKLSLMPKFDMPEHMKLNNTVQKQN